ncbi:MAG: hypothetical protein ACOCU1_02075 [Bacillota bacterium]
MVLLYKQRVDKGDVEKYVYYLWRYFYVLSATLIFSTVILLAIYFIMVVYAVILTYKYKATNPLVLLVLTVFLIGYILIDSDNDAVVYVPDGMHILLGLGLIIYGAFFAQKFQNENRYK